MSMRRDLTTEKDHLLNFMERVEKPMEGCWIWQGFLNAGGYGTHRYMGNMWLVHRLAYKLFVEDFPEDMLVCHSCDNRRCVNPRHLWLGNHKDNAMDMMKKGRRHFPRGVFNWNAKLNADQVKEIRETYVKGKRGSAARLAAKFDVNRGVITKIARGQSY